MENAYPAGTMSGLVSVPVVPTGLGPIIPPTVRTYMISMMIMAIIEIRVVLFISR